jgi:hypothetical protein
MLCCLTAPFRRGAQTTPPPTPHTPHPHSGKCKQTFRGHGDSVNQVTWVPYTNTLFTASADRTLSLWDARTGMVASTFYGHTSGRHAPWSPLLLLLLLSVDHPSSHPHKRTPTRTRTHTHTHTCLRHAGVNACAVSARGDQFFSADLAGTLKWWDTRMVSEQSSYTFPGGEASTSHITLDPSGGLVVCAMTDGSVRFVEAGMGAGSKALTARKEALLGAGGSEGAQWAAFDKTAKYLVVAGSGRWRGGVARVPYCCVLRTCCGCSRSRCARMIAPPPCHTDGSCQIFDN